MPQTNSNCMLTAQRLIAAPFLILGLWCLFAPGSVEALTIRPDYQRRSDTTALFIGCFGAQAVLNGVLVWFSRFTRTTFLAYGVALLPFFGFNYYFVYVEPIFNGWMALDFVANLSMLALCVVGWRASPKA